MVSDLIVDVLIPGGGTSRRVRKAWRKGTPAAAQVDPATSGTGRGLIDVANMSEPVGELSFEQWATALAHCKVNKVRLGDQDGFVQQFGVAPGQWSELSSHWSTEMRSNPRLMIAVREIEKNVKKQSKGR